MAKLKERVLRELGDQGADTLDRYFAQLQYSAYWCIRMLRSREGIEVVIPEGADDLIIIRRGIYELHQVKTRDESRGPWNVTEVVPILCQQYFRRKIFPPHCHFHFVSDQIADNKAQMAVGSLYRLKQLLEIMHSEQNLSSKELGELNAFENILGSKIQSIMLDKHKENIDNNTAIALLHSTWIETECPMVRTPDNIAELDAVMDEIFPGVPSYTYPQLQDIHDRLIMLIVRKIIHTTSIEERRIFCDDVLNCRSAVVSILANGYPDLDQVPGKTVLDKKARLGEFNPTEIPRFHRYKLLAENIRRRYLSLGMDGNLERLISALLECQAECREIICRVNGVQNDVGPQILRMLKPKLAPLMAAHPSFAKDVDDMICMGLLWRETDSCYAWWHALQDSA